MGHGRRSDQTHVLVEAWVPACAGMARKGNSRIVTMFVEANWVTASIMLAAPRGLTVDYFFFASSLSSLRASSIAGLGPKSSSSNNWRSSISPCTASPCGAGQRLAQSIASSFDLTRISQ